MHIHSKGSSRFTLVDAGLSNCERDGHKPRRYGNGRDAEGNQLWIILCETCECECTEADLEKFKEQNPKSTFRRTWRNIAAGAPITGVDEWLKEYVHPSRIRSHQDKDTPL